jgi:hypothetical protein|tara:strand:+ start:1197 stop:3119 length:1923 start_codon:yes stop_codon:yes gene_type:complete
MTTEVLSNNVFNKIRSKFGDVQLGDTDGNVTANPSEAVFYDFEYMEDSDTFGRMSISLADGESMKVFYNRNLTDKIDEDSKAEFFSFLKELKDLAVQHQLKFDVRDITKSNLSSQDFKNLADANQTVNTDEMSEEIKEITKLAGVEVKESLRGTTKSSYENLDKTRLIIRHKGKVDETVPGARSRQIQSLYIENSDGERYKYPLTHLAGARAMVRHVANGGKPHDDFGQHIIQTSEDIAKLNSFSRYAANKDQLNDNASDIIDQTKMKLENLRQYVRNIGKQSHYDETFKNFKTADERVLDDETRNTYREKFTLKTLDDRVEEALPLIHSIMSEYKTDDEPTDKDAKVEPPVDHGAIVQSWLTNPDNKLVLRKDDTADKMLSVTKFNNKNTMLGSILSDIAARMMSKGNEEDRVANFASRVADEIEKEGTPFATHDQDYLKNKKIAVMLAKRYIDDYKKMKSDPAYGDEVRVDPQAFAPKKDRQGKAKETAEFESWVNNIDKDEEVSSENRASGSPAHDCGPDCKKYGCQCGTDESEAFEGEKLTFEDIKPYVSMYRDKENNNKMMHDVLDKDGNSVFKTADSKAAMAFLSKNFAKMRSGELKGEPKKEDASDQEIAKDQVEAEKINTEVDRIKELANLS